MTKRWEIRLSGTGGQGMILAGIILASAGVKAGYNAVQSQSYGPEARGGASKAEVIISDDVIYFPKIADADILLAMSQQAYDKYSPYLKEKSVVIVDGTLVKNIDSSRGEKIYQMPITEIAKRETGREMTANITALGAIVGITNLVSEQVLREAVLERIPAGTGEINIKALNAGVKIGSEAVIHKAS